MTLYTEQHATLIPQPHRQRLILAGQRCLNARNFPDHTVALESLERTIAGIQALLPELFKDHYEALPTISLPDGVLISQRLRKAE